VSNLDLHKGGQKKNTNASRFAKWWIKN
jgi:hypothetical protein